MAEKRAKQEQKETHNHNHQHECDDPGCGHDHAQGNTHDHLHENMHNPSAEEDLQTKYYEFQVIGEQLKQLQQQAALMDEQNTELQLTFQGLNDLGNSKEGSKIMVPLSSGIYAEAELKDKSSLLVGVGNNIMVKKTLSKTKEMIEERISAVAMYKSEIDQNIQAHMRRAKELEAELNEMLKKARG